MLSQAAPLSTLNLTPPDLAELRSTASILQHLHHRNKNQHRVATWWKWFAMLRRCLARIVRDAAFVEKKVAEIEEVPVIGGGLKFDWDKRLKRRQRLREKREERWMRVEAEAGYLERELVPRCYRAFSNLIGDTQFAALGLVLLAVLARVRRVLGVEGTAAGADGDEVAGHEVGQDMAIGLEDVDVGELISREAVDEALGLGPSGSGEEREQKVDDVQTELGGERDGTALAVGRPRQRESKDGDIVDIVSARITPSSKPVPVPPVGLKGALAKELTQRSNLTRQNDSSGKGESTEDTEIQRKKGSERKKSKRRRPGNEIDDLFKGLV